MRPPLQAARLDPYVGTVLVYSSRDAFFEIVRRCEKYDAGPWRSVLRVDQEHDYSCLAGRDVVCMGQTSEAIVQQIYQGGARAVFFVGADGALQQPRGNQ